MKLSLALLFSAIASVAARTKSLELKDIKANSKFGRNLLEKSRRLENGDNEQEVAWLEGFSLKFQGCHHLYQWNDEVDEDEDVRLYSKRLVRFRLCPEDSCSASDAGGCSADYGDYVVDMHTYVNTYYESKNRAIEEECQNFLENNCGCEDNGDDQYDEAVCQYNCVVNAEMDQCVDFVQQDDEDGEAFDVEEFLYCAQWEAADDNGRKLEDAEEEAGYFVGPYCSGQGGTILLGMFSDDTCTTFVDEYGGKETFEQLAGFELPYSEDSIVDSECMSCAYVNNDNDQQEVEINEACQTAYNAAGKCESNLPSGTTYYPETSACNYISGIQVIREDGMVTKLDKSPSAPATAFIIIAALACAGMGMYVWYLRTRLGMKTDTLL